MKIAKLITTLSAIAAVTFLEYHAMANGIDGTALAAAIAVIAALGGYEAKALKSALLGMLRKK